VKGKRDLLLFEGSFLSVEVGFAILLVGTGESGIGV
jgi:hypothetical protein